MKDNFVEDEQESVADFFEQRRAEFRAQQKRRWIMRVGMISGCVFGVVTLANFDIRVGIGVGLLVVALVLYILET
jgi:hypothetical protein